MSAKESISEYLSSLNPGDTVFRMAGGSNLDKQRISRITSTQIILVSGGRYNLKTGQSIGGPTWNRSKLVLPTPEVKQAWQVLCLVNWATNRLPGVFKSISYEQQLDVYQRIQAMAEESKTPEVQISVEAGI